MGTFRVMAQLAGLAGSYPLFDSEAGFSWNASPRWMRVVGVSSPLYVNEEAGATCFPMPGLEPGHTTYETATSPEDRAALVRSAPWEPVYAGVGGSRVFGRVSPRLPLSMPRLFPSPSQVYLLLNA